MKKRFFLLCAVGGLCGQIVFAGEPLAITTTSGAKYERVTINRVEPDAITITHLTGVARIPLAELPADLQKQFGYDPHRTREPQQIVADMASPQVSTQTQKKDAQSEAEMERCRKQTYAAYPDLLDPNSDLSKLVQYRIQQAAEHPAFFSKPCWLFTLVGRSARDVDSRRYLHQDLLTGKGGTSSTLTQEEAARLRMYEAAVASDRKRNPNARGVYSQDEQGNVYRDGHLLPRSPDLIIDGRAH